MPDLRHAEAPVRLYSERVVELAGRFLGLLHDNTGCRTVEALDAVVVKAQGVFRLDTTDILPPSGVRVRNERPPLRAAVVDGDSAPVGLQGVAKQVVDIFASLPDKLDAHPLGSPGDTSGGKGGFPTSPHLVGNGQEVTAEREAEDKAKVGEDVHELGFKPVRYTPDVSLVLKLLQEGGKHEPKLRIPDPNGERQGQRICIAVLVIVPAAATCGGFPNPVAVNQAVLVVAAALPTRLPPTTDVRLQYLRSVIDAALTGPQVGVAVFHTLRHAIQQQKQPPGPNIRCVQIFKTADPGGCMRYVL